MYILLPKVKYIYIYLTFEKQKRELYSLETAAA